MGSRPREGGFAKEKLYSFLNYFFSSLCKPQKYLIIAWPQSRQHPPPQNTQVDDRCEMVVVSQAEANRIAESDGFLVHSNVLGHTYGVTRAALARAQATGQVCV